MTTLTERARQALTQGDATMASAAALVSIAETLERLAPYIQANTLASVSRTGGESMSAILDSLDCLAHSPSSMSSHTDMSSQSTSSATTGPNVASPFSWTAPNRRGGA